MQVRDIRRLGGGQGVWKSLPPSSVQPCCWHPREKSLDRLLDKHGTPTTPPHKTLIGSGDWKRQTLLHTRYQQTSYYIAARPKSIKLDSTEKNPWPADNGVVEKNPN